MEAQIYLDQSIHEAKIFMDKTTINRKDLDSKFEKAKSQEDVDNIVDNFNEEELRKYFKSSEILIDSQILFQKIASFIYFSRFLQIELDLSNLAEINGLLEFVTNYKPFETSSVLTSEGELQEKNTKVSDQKFEQFRSNLQNARKLLNETRS